MPLHDELPETGKAFLDELIKDGVMPDSMVVVASFIQPDGSPATATYHWTDDVPIVKVLGMLEMAKFDVMGAAGCGPFDPAWERDD
jgi:hypothetical protein